METETTTTPSQTNNNNNLAHASRGLLSAFRNYTEEKVKQVATRVREDVQRNQAQLAERVAESDLFKKYVAYDESDDGGVSTKFSASQSEGSDNKYHSDNEEEEDNKEEEETLKRNQSIGRVVVRVSRVSHLTSSVMRPFVTVCVGDEKVKGALAERGAVTWMPNDNVFELNVADLACDIRVQLWASNVVTSDALVGQVIIPIARLLPGFRAQPLTIQEVTFQESGWYEVFPLPKDRAKFSPAVAEVGRTGMDRPQITLGYMNIAIDFFPGNSSQKNKLFLPRVVQSTMEYLDWPSTLYVGPKKWEPRNPKPPLPSATDVARTVRHMKRQLKRLIKALESVFLLDFPPILALQRARAWTDPKFSVVFCFVVVSWIQLGEPWSFPLLLYGVLLTGAFVARSDLSRVQKEDHENNDKEPVWNDELQDPDDELNPMQLIGKLLWMLEKAAFTLRFAVDNLERLIHAFSFSEERATIVVLSMVGIVAIGASLALMLFPLRFFFSFVFTLGMIPNQVWIDQKFVSNRSRQNFIERLETSIVWNSLMRVPTTDDVGHLRIAELQRVSDDVLLRRLNESLQEQ